MKIILNDKIIKLFLSAFLSAFLLLAPIQIVLAGNFWFELEISSMANTSESSEHAVQTDKVHLDFTLAQHNHQDVEDESCDKQCANCVYCSAAAVTTSNVSFVLFESLFFKIPDIFLNGIEENVEIRPPIFL